jgi:DNA primase
LKFPQDFIDRVRESVNIVDIIGQYVQLRRTGGNHQGLCPFHNEKSPSFSVSEDKQVYHCFGCKESGNVISFVQKYQGLTFPETIEYLAARAGMAIPQEEGEQQNRNTGKDALYRVNALASQFFHQELKALPETHEARAYLKKRGLTPEVVDAYRIGYAPDSWTALADFFSSKKVPITLAEELGLIKRRTGGKSGHYDLFRHRLMFPIFSPARQGLGFGGRVLTPEDQPKYLNSPDSAVFHKGKTFYGLETSVKYIRSEDEIIVVEGYMDWLALAKVGVMNIAATLGTALTADHAKMIKRYTNKVLILFDGDNAGRAAAQRSLPILLEAGLFARGLFLPDELDPDEYIEAHGKDQLKKLIAGAPDLFELISNDLWSHSKSSPSGKVELLDQIAPILGKTNDPRLRNLYMSGTSLMIGVPTSLIEQSVNRFLVNAGSHQQPRSQPQVRDRSGPAGPGSGPVTESAALVPAPVQAKIDLKGLPKAELELLNVLLIKEVYLKEAIASGVMEIFSHPGAKLVAKRIMEVYRLMPNKFDNLSALLAGEVQPTEVVTRHLSEPYRSLNGENAAKLLQDCIKRVKENDLRVKSKELVSNLRGSNPADSSEQLEQIMNIHRDRRSLNRNS